MMRTFFQARKQWRHSPCIVLFILLSLIFVCLAHSAEFKDNPSLPINLGLFPEFGVVGELHKVTTLPGTKLAMESTGSAVIVGPCLAVSTSHVLLGGDILPIPRKDYSMTFSAGNGSDQGAFSGHTSALPIAWKETDPIDHEGLVILRLYNCVGTSPRFGWVELSDRTLESLVDERSTTAAVGYSDLFSRGQLRLGMGRIEGLNHRFNMLEHSGSTYNHASGGALLSCQSGKSVLVGIIVGDEGGMERYMVAHRDTWRPGLSGLAIPISSLRGWKEGIDLIERDKKAWGKPNPASNHDRTGSLVCQHR